MPVKYDFASNSIGIDPDFFARLVSIYREARNPDSGFRETFEFIKQNRGPLARLAARYHQQLGHTLISENAPLLIQPAWRLRHLHPITVDHETLTFVPDNQTAQTYFRTTLPTHGTYLQNIIKYIYDGNDKKAPYTNNLCYRLTDLTVKNGIHEFTFTTGRYFDYVNSCEYLMYEFARKFGQELDQVAGEADDGTSVDLKLDFKRSVDPFDFSNRSAVPGINTLLVFLDHHRPIFWLHERFNPSTVAEAVNTFHVVPAGTFQPIHYADSNHEKDFSFFRNTMREFGEELFGDKEIVNPVGLQEDVLDRASIAKYYDLHKRGRAKLFYAGTGLDCLTLKPEILTIMVFVKSEFEEIFGDVHFWEHNEEGQPFALPFNRETVLRYLSQSATLPAGAGCLSQAYTHFDELSSCIAF